MTLILNNRIRSICREFSALGRAVRIHINDYKYMNTSIVFLHGGHGDALATSLADAASLLQSRPRGSIPVLMGDLNVDQLPALALDP